MRKLGGSPTGPPPYEPFRPPRAVARLLEGLAVPWFVAGGWAIDLFLARETRTHEDIEVAILRKDQEVVRRHLRGWTFTKVATGSEEPWRENEWLNHPTHEIHARSRDSPKDLEILLNESDGDFWKFRRDPRITRPLSEIGRRSDLGVPYLCPEIVLLFKAKQPRARDQGDFALARPALSGDARAWLRRALEVAHPRHPWIADL